ncbi:amidase signature domain-containing protein [Annulohypoxylon moriforme]|nr:amidase signature domain-containing protein [Annulohypoxylon moriforme]
MLAIVSVLAFALAGVASSSIGDLKSTVKRVVQRRDCGENDNISPFQMPLCNGVSIEDATIDELQRWMTLGKLTSEQLVQCYLARIEQTNPYLHSISEVNPDALSIAASLDQERASCQGTLGPLHGIPFVVKDNVYTDDRHNTSEGGLVLLGGRAAREASIVQRLRAAGAVLLGHASLSEAADHRALTNFSDGYSTRAGQIRNPFNLTQGTSGSSGGSAVAVRSNQAAVAIGTETHGSLVHPASHLGLYTLKSTPGLISRHGIVPGSFYHDTPGPMARSMKDVALLLDVMAGADRYDNLTWNALGKYPSGSYAAKVVKQDALKGMKLGIPWNPYWSTNPAVNAPDQRVKYEGLLNQLRAAGAEIYNLTSIPGLAEIANPYGFGQPSSTPDSHNQLNVYTALLAVAYGEWLVNWTFPADDDRATSLNSLADMAAWNDAHNATTGALGNSTWWYNTVSGQDFYDLAVATNGSLADGFWTTFNWGRRVARGAIDSGHAYVREEDGVVLQMDALLVPNDDVGGGSQACASIPSYAGYPVAAVPVGQTGYGVPFGLCVWGREWSEANLVRVASAMEDLFRWEAVPGWHNYESAEGIWEATWPGYTCSTESLDGFACDPGV